MNEHAARELLGELAKYPNAKASHGQLDEQVAQRCKALATQARPLRKTDLQPLLDDCVYYSLCTDFVMVVLKEIKGMLPE